MIDTSLKQRDTIILHARDKWFQVTKIWYPASRGRPEAYATLAIKANQDVERYSERQLVRVAT
ncbi:hypothetical protein B0E33_10435 [Roseibium algicola]|uniref:Uncharacterized protein n=1 Tax=Roseibium algicola TaxID=2857014 RepID=A0ABN4WV44_9HYPH|nr:hypothetical protein B0E33_10435 [Roseibium aggregatum]